MRDLFNMLLKLEFTISCCESITAGLFMSKLAEISGASKVFKGGIVSYWNEVKEKLVGVDKSIIDSFGVVSAKCAEAMAINVANKFKTNVAVSFTGNAGPDTLEGKEAGLIYSTIKINDEIYTFEDKLSGSRNEIRNEIVEITAQRLTNFLRNIYNSRL